MQDSTNRQELPVRTVNIATLYCFWCSSNSVSVVCSIHYVDFNCIGMHAFVIYAEVIPSFPLN